MLLGFYFIVSEVVVDSESEFELCEVVSESCSHKMPPHKAMSTKRARIILDTSEDEQ